MVLDMVFIRILRIMEITFEDCMKMERELDGGLRKVGRQ
jgi:hypothetical protein